METAGDELGDEGRDDVIALHVAAGMKLSAVAAKVGYHVRSVQRRLRDPEFAAKVRALRGQMLAEAAGLLADGMAEAAGGLRELCGSADEDMRHKSCVKVLELGLKMRDAVDTDQRLAAVEAALLASNKGVNDGVAAGTAGEGGGGGGQAAGGPNGPVGPVQNRPGVADE